MFMTRFAPPLAFHFLYAMAMPPLEAGKPVRTTACTIDCTSTHYNTPQDYENTVFFASIGSHIQNAPLFGVAFTTWAPLVLLPYVALLLTGVFDRMAARLAPRTVAFDHEYTMGTDRDTGTRLLHLECEAVLLGALPGGTTLPMLTQGQEGGRAAGRVGAARPWQGGREGGRGLARCGLDTSTCARRGDTHTRNTGPCWARRTPMRAPRVARVGGHRRWGRSRGAFRRCWGVWARGLARCRWSTTRKRGGGGGGDGLAGVERVIICRCDECTSYPCVYHTTVPIVGLHHQATQRRLYTRQCMQDNVTDIHCCSYVGHAAVYIRPSCRGCTASGLLQQTP